MARSLDSRSIQLALSEDQELPSGPAQWIGPLVALGGMVSGFTKTSSDRQLIVAVSVPRRDFAAVLVGCGWIAASSAPELKDPAEILRSLAPGTPVRIVTEYEVLADHFVQLRRVGDLEEVEMASPMSKWMLPKIKAVSVLRELAVPVRGARPELGSVGRWCKLGERWNQLLAVPPRDLAIVGTRRWLGDDLRAFLSVDEPAAADGRSVVQEADRVAGLVLPEGVNAATWFTRIYPSSQLADQLPLPEEARAVVLDGTGAIKYLAEIESSVVVCVLDRSIADDAAAERIVQLRNTRGEPLSLSETFGWRPPVGVEALAFTVPL